MEWFAINESKNPVSYWQGEDGQNLLTTIHNFKTKPKGTDSVHFTYIYIYICFPQGPTAPSGPKPYHCWGFTQSHSDTPHLAGLHWKSNQPITETSTQKHTTFTRGRHPVAFKQANPTSKQPQTHTSDYMATLHIHQYNHVFSTVQVPLWHIHHEKFQKCTNYFATSINLSVCTLNRF